MAQRPLINMAAAIQSIVGTASYLKGGYEDLVGEWSPDVPPPTIVFSHFGERLCYHAEDSKASDLAGILKTVEELMVYGNEAVRTAVATGLLETILAECDMGRFELSIILPFLGPESLDHCKEWDEFTGAKTKGLW